MSDSNTPEDGRTTRERMLAGDLYIADDPELARDSLRAMRLMEAYNPGRPMTPMPAGGSWASCWARSGRGARSVRRSTSTTATTCGSGPGSS